MDPGYFGASSRARLAELAAGSRMSAEDIGHLIEFTNSFSQTLDFEGAPYAQQRSEMQRIAADCDRLLDAIANLHQQTRSGLLAHAAYLIHGSAPGIDLPTSVYLRLRTRDERLLSSAWDWIDAMRVSALYAASKTTVSKQAKPEQIVARGLVSMIADYLKRLTGELPPKSPEGWFSLYMTYVGEQLHLPIGPRVVKSGIEQVAR